MNNEKYKQLKDNFYSQLKSAELYKNYSAVDSAHKLLNKCKHHFLMNDVYIYSILINLEITINNDFATACLCYKEDWNPKYKIFINPYFFLFMNELDFEFALFLVLHEVYHFLMSHLFSRKGNIENKDRKIKNIAQDLAINSTIICYFDKITKMNPEFFPLPGFGEYKDIPKYLSYEEYESLLLKRIKNGESAPSGNTLDDHESNQGKKKEKGNGNDDSEVSEEDENQEGIEELIKEIDKDDLLEKCGDKPGKYTSSSIRNLIKDKANKNTLNPKTILSFFIQKCTIKYQKMNSFRKINKKYINVFPGRKVTRKPRIAIFVDESGSVSDVLLSRFFALIDDMTSELSMFDVIPFDYVVDVNNIQKIKQYKRPQLKRVKQGGTNFQAVIDYANKSKYDGIVILTDLGCNFPGPSKMRRIWISNVKTDKFGTDINLTL